MLKLSKTIYEYMKRTTCAQKERNEMKRARMWCVILITIMVVFAGAVNAAGNSSNSVIGEVVKPFYTKCLTVNDQTDIDAVMNQILSDDFQSIGSTKTKNKAQMIAGVKYLWSVIPDLKWEPQEIIQTGNKVIVRSLVSGSPNGDFMGMKLDGTKSFKIMSIDIHTIENNQIKEVYHIEDWGTALQQLK